MAKRVCIIGAGPAGLTAAYKLSLAGIEVDVYELSDRVGGMCKSIPVFGCNVDMGPHRFFSNDKRVNELWLEIVGNEYAMVQRRTRIYYGGVYYSYPLKGIEAVLKLGVIEGIRCIVSYLKSKIKGDKAGEDFESWVVSRFGRRLFDTFFRSYSEKLWGIRCSELDSDFASQRIKKFSMWEAIKSTLGISREKHKTLVDEFAYPLTGTGFVYERMAEAIKERGGKVLLGKAIKSMVQNESGELTGIELRDGERKEYDFFVSTMPLTLLVKSLSPEGDPVRDAINSLEYRYTILVYIEVCEEAVFDDQWLYIHSEEVSIGRVTNFNNWVDGIKSDSGHTVLCSELWCNVDDDLWKEADDRIIDKVGFELVQIGLVRTESILGGKVVRVPRSYPVYKKGYKSHLKKIETFLKRYENLYPIGRYGAFKYNNQDHSILMGILVSENIAEEKNHNLWDVNTDYDVYQELSTITSSGLVINELE